MKLRLPSRRYVYVFNVTPENSLIPFLWSGKVGFSVNADTRAADVEQSIFEQYGVRVRLKRTLCVKVFMYRGIEGAVHRFLKIMNDRRYKQANGGTEFFLILNVLTGLLSYLLLYGHINCAAWIAGCVMLAPLPLDMCLLVLLLAAVEYIGIGVFFYLLWTGVATWAGV